MKIQQQFQLSSTLDAKGKFIAGVELEIESIANFGNHSSYSTWQITEDGSLRNGGKELISPPLELEKLVEDFKNIHKNLVFFNKKDAFSERTSIHVHVNMLDNSLEEAKSLLLWYSLFEPCFFAMVESKRRNNIHCVGLDQTNMSEHYNRSLPFIVGKWHKYAAFNMKPLQTIGTIEFRHMEGHNDPARFAQWLLTLKNLWSIAQMMPMQESVLTKQGIEHAFDLIFKDAPNIKALKPSLSDLIANNVTDVKLSFLPNTKE